MIKLIALFMVLLGTPGRDSVKSETGEGPACLREYFTFRRGEGFRVGAERGGCLFRGYTRPAGGGIIPGGVV